MATLNCRLFTTANAATAQRLEHCANGYPNEVASHLAPGSSGEYVRLVQVALATIDERSPVLAIPDFTITGVYDAAFAAAVFQYKRAKGILNWAGAVDNIVGRKTIASIDRDMQALEGVAPTQPPLTPLPPTTPPVVPAGACVPRNDCPYGQRFTLQLLGGLTGGEVIELGMFLFDIRDVANGLQARYVGKVVGIGVSLPIPVNMAVLGSPTGFATSEPCRVTDFFAFAISGVALQFPIPLSISPVSLSYKTRNGLGQTMPFNLDTGPVNLPGAAVHAGSLDLQTQCNGQPGATRG